MVTAFWGALQKQYTKLQNSIKSVPESQILSKHGNFVELQIRVKVSLQNFCVLIVFCKKGLLRQFFVHDLVNIHCAGYSRLYLPQVACNKKLFTAFNKKDWDYAKRFL